MRASDNCSLEMPLPATQEYCPSGKPVRCLIRNNARGKTCPCHHIACWRKPPCMRVAIRFRGRPEPPSPDRSAIAMRPEFDPHIWKTMHHVDRPAWQGCIALRHIQHSAQSVSRRSTIEAGSWKNRATDRSIHVATPQKPVSQRHARPAGAEPDSTSIY